MTVFSVDSPANPYWRKSDCKNKHSHLYIVLLFHLFCSCLMERGWLLLLLTIVLWEASSFNHLPLYGFNQYNIQTVAHYCSSTRLSKLQLSWPLERWVRKAIKAWCCCIYSSNVKLHAAETSPSLCMPAAYDIDHLHWWCSLCILVIAAGLREW